MQKGKYFHTLYSLIKIIKYCSKIFKLKRFSEIQNFFDRHKKYNALIRPFPKLVAQKRMKIKSKCQKQNRLPF